MTALLVAANVDANGSVGVLGFLEMRNQKSFQRIGAAPFRLRRVAPGHVERRAVGVDGIDEEGNEGHIVMNLVVFLELVHFLDEPAK